MIREIVSPAFLAASAIGLIVLLGIPLLSEEYTLFNLTVFAVMALMAMSLNLVWGIGGILSLGQAVFFGLGGYAYAITAMNVDSSSWGLVAAMAVPAVFALLMGYFTFYGRISDVYFGVVSLTLSLIMYNLVNSTSGDFYRIGSVQIGGYNGIPSVPPISLPGASEPLDFAGMYYLAGGAMLLAYLGTRLFVKTPFGRVVISIRENELRAELLGYDVRRYKLLVFILGAVLSGIAGALFAAWGAFIGPDNFAVGFAAQTIIWVLFGGLGTLIGPVVGAMLITGLTTWLGSVRLLEPNIVLGLVFVISVLVLPTGVVPAVQKYGARFLKSGKGARS